MLGDVLLALAQFAIGVSVGAGGAAAYLWWASRRDEIAANKAVAEAASRAEAQNEIVAAWLKWNQWYLRNPELSLEAQQIHMARRAMYPDEPLEENLAEVSVEMRMRHPEIAPTLN